MQLAIISQSPISPFLEQQGFVLLDGGLATELERCGHNLNNNLWSASLLNEHHGEIQKVHQSYLIAGADCITAATYQASIPGFMDAGFSEHQAGALISKAVDIACDARDQYFLNSGSPGGLRPLVAASIGPYGAYLADGSEFRGDYVLSGQELRSFHEPRWEILLDSPADLFAIETIPSFREAKVLLEMLKASPGVSAWISFSCADGMNINDGTPISECVELFAGCDQIVGIGVNCTAPQHICSLIQQVRNKAVDKPVVVYPNSGEIYDGIHGNWKCPADPIDFGAAAVEWFDLGANLLGGCCRTEPRHIAEMKSALQNNASRNGN